jgi:gamma-D-glutamyl-L-lysine dipeptidyl-peptidase
MEFGLCNLSIVPCRKEPADTSEMVTQLLFGEHFEVLEKTERWVKIKIAFDQYEAWISNKQYISISKHTFDLLQAMLPHYCSNDLLQIIINKQNNQLFPIVFGSTLPFLETGECSFENQLYSFEGEFSDVSIPYPKAGIVDTALFYLHAPYLWGGKSHFGMDCSGLTQMAYKMNGIALKRDASQQAEMGETLSFVEESEPGDLAFFDNEEGKIIHVGIVMNNNKIIHASGKVRVDSFDHQGIYNADKKSYTHHLRLLKRML